MKKKILAVTMGDPGGLGAEIVVRAVASPAVRKCCIPVIIGDAGVMQEAIALLRLPTAIKTVSFPEEIKLIQNTIHVIDMKSLPGIKKRMPTPEGGAACARYIRKAVELASGKKVDGIVTAPISKEAMKMAGLPWPGHTEMLAELTGTKDYAMMLAGGPLRVILVTIHTAISQVPELITKQRVLKTIRLAEKACRMLKIKRPKIAVAGLNPHAGEAGMFGDEEINAIIPAIRAAVKEGIPVSGPWPPDTVFHKAYRGELDMVVCMYHDQGLIPLKMIAFDTGVNVTVGLPFVRTSPDHGTAYDIAWKGIANPSSMIEAIKVASQLHL
ncbi:MAG: 4-hydroxythreonine-4-phosphate dehydrogenase PdxA [Thermodesulfovibrionales bacterium]|nr:4-hydroxythreonine-4-phosphate dehydrogenase PdxA [Thermodesulfovibrionales bacterium]